MLQFAFIYLLHILSGHGSEVEGMMGNWKMSEGVKQSGGEVGKWIELTVFRLRIVHKERKWVLAAHGHAVDQLGMPGSKFHAI